MVYTLLTVLLLLAAASLQVASASAFTSAYSDSRRSLWPAQHFDGLLEQDRMEGITSGTIIDSYAIIGNSQHRQLQHGEHMKWRLPACPRCKLHGSNALHTHKKGHCRKSMQRFACWKPKDKARFFFASAAASGFPSAASSANSTSMPTAPGEELVLIVQVSDGNTSTVAAGVGCFNDSDCELSATALAPVDGGTPMSRRGVVIGECLGAVRKEEKAGVCVCAYTDRPVDGGDTKAAERNADMAVGNGLQSTLEGTSQTSEIIEDVAPKFDICVRQSSSESVSVVTDSAGSPRLMNSTASGTVMLDVELIEAEQNVAKEKVSMDGVESNALVILAAGMPFSDDELSYSDDDRSEPVDEVDDNTPFPGPVPAPAPAPSPGSPPTLSPQGITNTPTPTPGPTPAPATPPGPPSTREAFSAPTPAQAPTQGSDEKTAVHGSGSGANRQTAISEDLELTMRLQDA